MIASTLTSLFVFVNTAWKATASSHRHGHAKCASDSFDASDVVPGTTILSIEATEQLNYTSGSAGAQAAVPGLDFCRVKIYLTHQTKHDVSLGLDDANDSVLVELWLPLSSALWNGRLQVTGGAGFATGMFGAQLGVAVKNGWAAVSTDGGHSASVDSVGDASWAIKADGSVNWHLLQNFASRSVVEQIPIGKRVTEQYYGVKPHHSYWNGCSTGGRQGYAIAQRFPHLVDGILANAPAVSFTHLVTSLFWPQLRMRMSGTYLSECELEYYQSRVVEACDYLDGVVDGIIEDPEVCDLDPHVLVGDGRTFECDGKQAEFTTKMAQLITEIHQGPKSSLQHVLLPGLARGVSMDSLSKIHIAPDGTRSQSPFRICASWLKHLVLKNAMFNLSEITDTHTYFDLFGLASYEFGGLLDTDNPDLSALQSSGTKMITWHGLYDELIPYENTISYRKKVEGVMGGAHRVDDYFRLFLAPGIAHCGGGAGAQLKDPLGALVDWAENDDPPETLDAERIDAEGELVTRDVCAWPAKPKYMGIGSAKRASSWSCVGGAERGSVNEEEDLEAEGRVQRVMNGIVDRLEGMGMGLSIG